MKANITTYFGWLPSLNLTATGPTTRDLADNMHRKARSKSKANLQVENMQVFTTKRSMRAAMGR